MKKRLIHCLIFTTVMLLFSGQSYAIDANVQNIYNIFFEKVEKKYNSEQQYKILKKVRDIATDIQLDEEKQGFIKDILALNNEALYNTWLQEELNQSSQQLIELRERLSLEKNFKNDITPTDINKLISPGKRDYIVTNEDREFLQNGEIYRIEYSKYFIIDSSSIGSLKNKAGIMIREKGEERFIEDYKFEKKIPYSEISKDFTGFFTPDHKIVARNGNYYAYNFTNFHFFDDHYGVYESQLESSGLNKSSNFVYRDENGRYNFVKEYGAHGIITANTIFGVFEKHLFLDALREDSRYPTTNIGMALSEIQKITEGITAGKNKNQKIEAIYNWLLENISYSSNVNLSNEKIFSAIETYKNKDGVCTGYTKLMLYMLLYAGVYDAEVIRGHVIDAADFPNIGHAWLRIDDKYYDPTFDDPVGLSVVKTREQYKYFGLPKDIFYSNRFEYGDLPEVFNTAVDAQIHEYIYTYLLKLIPKYEGHIDEYKIFTPVLFREKYNIGIHETITPELISQKTGGYKIINNSFTFIENNTQRRISHIRYYVVDDENMQNVLETLNYDIEDVYLFDWEISPGHSEWRLAYEIELQ